MSGWTPRDDHAADERDRRHAKSSAKSGNSSTVAAYDAEAMMLYHGTLWDLRSRFNTPALNLKRGARRQAQAKLAGANPGGGSP